LDFVTAFFVAFALIFVAEMGDKSQLLSLWFATKYRVAVVMAGVACAVVVLQLVAVVVGVVFDTILPERVFLTLAGISFFVFAAWSLRPEEDDDVEETVDVRRFGTFGIVFLSFLASELGDKTQLATVTLAGDRNPFGVWAGSTLGMIGSNALAVLVGAKAGKRLPRRAISYGAAVLFAIFGAVTLWSAWT
jgi:Ca2+/H+ antiporter, TMEM165/GDT1 family